MRKRKKISIVLEYSLILAFFIIGCNLFVYFKTSGLDWIFDDDELRPFQLKEAHIKATLGGLLFGLLVLFLETKVQPLLSKYFVLWQRRILWVLSILLFIYIIGVIANVLFLWIVESYTFYKSVSGAYSFLTSGIFISFTVHCFFLSLAVSFIRQLRITFGETVFLNYLSGKYSKPLVEHRTFMFLDLNNSTQIAETLGHIKYSRFLNKCFDNILEAMKPFKYEVYQFVGDEVVLTWKTKNDLDGKAMVMFEAVRHKLNVNKESFKKQFGIVPVFKAGVSSGAVSATLVGRKQKRVAYHGDVLNTTARLLGHCKKLGTLFLCTDFYLRSLKSPLTFEMSLMTELKLRGKNNTSLIYGTPLFNLYNQ
ncbi:adenylate/guanylate cyclase domain-containing protein [Winogradskyella sp.]|uniref:adenylate/guanylate cyclase domain-containing protein n=1 Tax=Winogradskyella sp. TaxID=1883156 RepID=UPI00260AAF32|nr:adenylate/guanylate cyclase domain-containing protein [Winogradskyella sp.]